MSLQFIYGRAHSGKTSYVLEEAQRLSDSGVPVIIVVPEQFTHIAEKRLISKIGAIVHGKVEVLSFDRICKRINYSYPGDKQHLSSIGKTLIISEVISSLDLSYYKSAALQSGFVDICNEEISEFKKYMITPEQLEKASQNASNRALSMKLSDMAAIYRAYEQKISSDFVDSDDSLGILASNLQKYRPYEGYSFFFDEFSSFNPQEREIISLICEQAVSVSVALCADKDENFVSLFKPTLECAKKVSDVCLQRGCTLAPEINLGEPSYANAEMAFLEENLYSYNYQKYNEKISKIRIMSSENPYAEVCNVASQINSLIRERNVRYRDISVTVSDIDEYGYIIKSVFKDYNIPFFVDEKTNTLDHAVVSFVINILDIYISGYSAETVVNYLKSGCITAKREDIYIADNYIGATRATKNTWLSDERFDASSRTYADGDRDILFSLNRIRDEHISHLASFHDEIKGRHSVKYITAKLYDFLIGIKFDQKISEYIKIFKKQNNTSLAKQYESVWSLLIEVFDMLVYILGDKTVNISEYRKYIYTALNQQQIGLIPTSLDEIIVGDVMRSKSGYATYQFVLGAADGKFPGNGNDSSLISDAEKNDLQNMGIELSPGINEKAYFDRFRIYSILTHPQNALIISYPNSDSGFSALRPALVITNIKNIFPSVSTEGSVSCDGPEYSDNEFEALQLLAQAAAAVSEGRDAPDGWEDIYAYFVQNGKADKIDFINRILNSKHPIRKLSPEIANRCFDDEFYSTISRIQKYNSCQYAYYLTYMLSLKEKKPFSIESVDIGNIIHGIIETVFTDLKKKGKSLEDTDCEFYSRRIDGLLEDYIQTLKDDGNEISEREAFSIRNLKASVYNAVMAIRSHIVKSEFEPIGHEISFDDKNIGCIEFELNNGKKLKITGKIDRADSFTNEDGTFIRVVDYKTGNKTFNFTDVFYGLDIQLLVYLNALVDKTPSAYPAGALFLKIQNPLTSSDTRTDTEDSDKTDFLALKMDGVVADESKILSAFSPDSISTRNKISSSQFRQLSEYVNSVAVKAAENMSDGYININPYSRSDSSSCNFCPYNCVCNFTNGKNGTFRSLSTHTSKTMFDEIKSNTETEGQ